MTIREFIQRLVEIVRDAILRQGTATSKAWEVAIQVARRFLETFRSESLYIPRGTVHAAYMRHQEMLAKYRSGASYAELAQHYSMTEPAVRLVLRKMLKAQQPKPLSGETRQGEHDEE